MANQLKDLLLYYNVSAYASENQLVLCQQAVDEKSNEITAVPELLNLIECKDTIITVDALNCQTKIAEKVIEKEADYIFALKSNQGDLYQEVVSRFEKQKIDSKDIVCDIGHGRIEKRSCEVIDNLIFVDSASNWLGMKSIIKIKAERYFKSTGSTQTETRYYISSLKTNAALINKSVRNHLVNRK